MTTDTVHWIILIFVILNFLITLFGAYRAYGPRP